MSLTSFAAVLMIGTAATSCLFAAPENAATPGNQTVVAEVNGVKLTLEDLEKKNAAALFQARTNYYGLERKVVQGYIDDYLVESQAKKEGLSVTELFDRHVNSKIGKDPTEEALRVFYEGIDTTEPFEAIREKIIESIKQRRIAKAKAAYMDDLRKQSTLVLRLAPPRAPVSMKDVPVRGNPNAAVTILEFADYECAYCQQIHPVLLRLENEFKGKIAFAYKDYPLPMHPSAPAAAEAAHCAGAQGKYWEYHDILFDKKQLTPDALRTHARELKLDTAKFDSCLAGGQMTPVVAAQSAEAQSLVLQGTPTILVNGRLLAGDLSYENLRAAVVEELSAVGGAAQPVARGSIGER